MSNPSQNQNWAVVLAAGDGTRLRELTRRGGVDTPKQFCSLRGGRSLLGDALARAARIAPKKRILVVVAEQHRRFFEPELAALPRENVIVQPSNRGTAAGILLPLLAVLERDPEARIAFLPSDHFVAREVVIEAALRFALDALDEPEAGLTLLGITPDAPESGYGWIVPRASERLLRPVERFVEKPPPALAAELFAHGALWNSFLFAAKGATLRALFAARLPELLGAFEATFTSAPETRAARFEQLYAALEARDFSREILQECTRELRLEQVPPCGWTDLGTPERVAACLAAFAAPRAPRPKPPSEAPLDLALALGARPAALSA
jgi:mannose-1-phosphate guanylyltransferase